MFNISKKKFILFCLLSTAIVGIAFTTNNLLGHNKIEKYTKSNNLEENTSSKELKFKSDGKDTSTSFSINEEEQKTNNTENNQPKNKEDEQETQKTDTIKTNNTQENLEKQNQNNYKEIFKEDLFLGDSITYGNLEYNILDKKNVYAKIGNTISQVKELSKTVDFIPKRIFILCGINNLGDGLNSNSFKSDYSQLIDTVKNKFPNSKIYVQSVLPVKSEKFKSSDISSANEIIKTLSKEKSINYIDIYSLPLNSNTNLYEPDGIHYTSTFYPIWLNYVKEQSK